MRNTDIVWKIVIAIFIILGSIVAINAAEDINSIERDNKKIEIKK